MPNDKALIASDEFWMEEALRAAQRALEAGEVPVGAIVVYRERLSAEAGTATSPTPTPPPTLKSSPFAKPLLTWVTIAWETANCLLQLSRVQCARARWCTRE